MRARSNPIWFLACVLCLGLIAASADSRPDPPAVNPHPAMAKVLSLRDCADCIAEQPGMIALPARPAAQRLWVPHEDEPDRPSDVMTRTGHAADTSPPVTPRSS